MQIADPASAMPQLLRIGFRPFFLGALLFALITMTQWMLLLSLGWGLTPAGFSAAQWHGHEMIFGYAGAVIAGFLLTAVQNWTQRKTVDGIALALLFGCWVAARLAALAPVDALLPAVLLFDTVFLVGLILALVRPLLAAGNHKQWGIIGKILLLLASNICFYLAAWGALPPDWLSLSLLLGVYTVVGLILMMARRVVPSFTQAGIPEAGPRPNHRWVDLSSLIFFVLFMLADILAYRLLAIASGTAFIVVSAVRWYGWHHPGIWSRPLLWVLYVGYLCIPAGIGLKVLALTTDMSPMLGLHLLAFGGIGLFTAGMMARVSLGHTGRDVTAPPRSAARAFTLLIVGALIRSVAPLLMNTDYGLMLLVAQLCWLAAFALLLSAYAGILAGPRADGRYA